MRNCDVCGRPLPPQTGRGGRRKRHETCSQRRRSAQTAAKPLETPQNLFEAVQVTLERLGEQHSARGMGALGLARRIVVGDDTGSALAALYKELRATLDDVEARAVPAQDDPVQAAIADLRLVN